VYYALAVPETRPGEWRNLSVLSTLKQCWQVVAYKNPTGGRHPIMFAFTGSFSAAVFMTFITNASLTAMQTILSTPLARKAGASSL